MRRFIRNITVMMVASSMVLTQPLVVLAGGVNNAVSDEGVVLEDNLILEEEDISIDNDISVEDEDFIIETNEEIIESEGVLDSFGYFYEKDPEWYKKFSYIENDSDKTIKIYAPWATLPEHFYVPAKVTYNGKVYDTVLSNSYSGKLFSGAENTKHIFIENGVRILGASSLFSDLSNLQSVDMTGIDLADDSLSGCFENCKSLKEVKLGDVSKVTSMSGMFYGCEALEDISFIKTWNTSAVMFMSSMFYGCKSLTEADLSGIKTSNVLNVEDMFCGCEKLQKVKLSNLDLSKMTSKMDFGLASCKALKEVDLSGVNLSNNVYSVNDLFGRDNTSLEKVNLSKMDISGVTSLESMFSGYISLKDVNFSGIKTGNITSMSNMFSNCSSLERVDLTELNFDEVTNMSRMFENCTSIEKMVIPDINTVKCQSINNMFGGCTSLKSLDMRGLRTDSLHEMTNLLSDCTALTSLYLPNGMANVTKRYATLPKDMYHDNRNDLYKAGTQLTPNMAGWHFIAGGEATTTIGNPRRDSNGNTIWDCIWFGRYYNKANQDYPYDSIKWRILNIDSDGNALLLSDLNLYSIEYNNGNACENWDNSAVRTWLNDDFKNTAFSFIQKSALEDINGDKVSLLTTDQVGKEAYGFNDFSKADNAKVAINSQYCENGYSNWLLKEPYMTVEASGEIYKWDWVDDNQSSDFEKATFKVRPIIKINLKKNPTLWADAGTVCSDGTVKKVEYEEPANRLIRYTDDTWAFNNSNEEPYGGFVGDSKYYISENAYNDLINKRLTEETDVYNFVSSYLPTVNYNNTSNNRQILEYSKVKDSFEEWAGSCEGLALSEGLYKSKVIYPIGSDGKTSGVLGDVGNIKNRNTEIEALINKLYFMQDTHTNINARVWSSSKINESYFENLVNKAKNIQVADDFFMISLKWQGINNAAVGHTVLCYGGEQCDVTDKNGIKYNYRLLVYDPNYSIYHDDGSDIYISADRKTAYVPNYNNFTSETSYSDGLTIEIESSNYPRMYYVNTSLKELFNNPARQKATDHTQPINGAVRSSNEEVSISAGDVLFLAYWGIMQAANAWNNYLAWFDGPNNYVPGLETEFSGGFYHLGEIDPNEAFTVSCGNDEALDADFEYADYLVGVKVDKPGASATFSNCGDVKIDGLNDTNVIIQNVYNDTSLKKPGDNTNNVIVAKASGKVIFTQSADEGYEISSTDGGLRDVSILTGSMLENSEHKMPDALGKIEVTFDGGVVSVHEDTDGDGNIDYEKIIDTGDGTEVPEGLWIGGVKSSYTYTGSAVKPSVSVYNRISKLKAKADYTVKYTNNTKAYTLKEGDAGFDPAKAPTITVTGKGNYSGKDVTYFVIEPKSISDEDISVSDIASVQENSKTHKPVPKIVKGKKKLALGKDFTIEYLDSATKPVEGCKTVGEYVVRITGKGNYTGTVDKEFSIYSKTLIPITKAKLGKIPGIVYTGSAVTPQITLAYAKQKLIEGTDYELKYKDDRTQIGKKIVEIIGKGKYGDKKVVSYSITGRKIESAKITGLPNTVEYTGASIVPKPTVTFAEGSGSNKKTVTLVRGTDYTVSYSNNTKPGKATVVITGKGLYTGSVKKIVKITPFNIAPDKDTDDKFAVSLSENTVPYRKGNAGPKEVVKFNGKVLTKGKDYTVSYLNTTKLATSDDVKAPTVKITGKGNFKGVDATLKFNIVQADIGQTVRIAASDKAAVTANKAKGAWKSLPVLKDKVTGKKLEAGVDYYKDGDREHPIVYYLTNDVNKTPLTKDSIVAAEEAGTSITAIVTGKGNYTGTIECSYRVIKQDISKLTATVKSKTFTGDEVKLAEGDISFKLGNSPVTLTLGTDYEIDEESYMNNINKGKATVVIKGKGNYGGSKTVTYTIGAKKFLWFFRNSN